LDPNTIYYVFLFVISFLGVLIATPLIIKFAYQQRITDQPGHHKIHSEVKPLLGGLAIFSVFAATIFFFLPVDDKLTSLVLSTVVLVVTGIVDDIYNIKPAYKLVGQFIAASIVIIFNAYLFRFMIDFFEGLFLPGFVVIGLIIGWVVLMVNAFNLIDGIDGLAAGTAAIIFLAMVALSIIDGGRPNILGAQLIGAGACLGFLLFNFNPARIYLGDTGSMLLGFILATTHLFTIKHPFSASMVLGSIFIFAYPALDISYAIYRRITSRTPLFKADRGHIHHVLLSLGFSVRKTTLVIYAVNIFFALLAVILLSLELGAVALLVIGILTALFVVFLFRYLLVISSRNGVGVKKA